MGIYSNKLRKRRSKKIRILSLCFKLNFLIPVLLQSDHYG